jgi:hypothetical protein
VVREQGLEAKTNVRGRAAKLPGEFFFDVDELVRQAARVDEDHTALHDAVVPEVGVE